jgi:hypothetical protein
MAAGLMDRKFSTRMPAPRRWASALADPTDYFELTFSALAGWLYHIWMRGKADSNH